MCSHKPVLIYRDKRKREFLSFERNLYVYLHLSQINEAIKRSSSILSNNSEANASELLENIEEMVPW